MVQTKSRRQEIGAVGIAGGSVIGGLILEPESPNILTASANNISLAATLIRDGYLVAFPTETVYGLGADATRDEAVKKVFAAKARPASTPLIVHVGNLQSAKKLARFGETAQKLAAAFWPGGISLVLPRLDECGLSHLVSAGRETIAIRIPDHPVALAMLEEAGCPVTAPSANPHGGASPTRAEDVSASMDIRAILDGGPCVRGVESTIVDVTHQTPRILRSGAITEEEIKAVIGPVSR